MSAQQITELHVLMSETPTVKLKKELSSNHYASDSEISKPKDGCSTPVKRKRCVFDEPSSPDEFSSPISLSQDEAYRDETDVTWEWGNSPQNINEISKRKPTTKFCLLGKKMGKKKVIKKSDFVNEAARGGFFKFEEDLRMIGLTNPSTDSGISQTNPNVHEENSSGIDSHFSFTSSKISSRGSSALCAFVQALVSDHTNQRKRDSS